MTTSCQTSFLHGWQEIIRFQELNQGLISPTKSLTASFLTATTLMYAIGAGITTVSGTILAL